MKKFNANLLFLFLTAGFFSACENKQSEPEDAYTYSTVAKNYLDEVLGIMQNNSLKKYTIDWTDFKDEVLAEADGAETIEDTYPAIQKALELLEDNHSSFIKPDGTGFTGNIFTCSLENSSETTWPENIGYVRINGYSGAANDEDAINYAKAIQQQIRVQDNPQIAGWVVDLRGNLGGNMWPMLAGIGPILGEATAGYAIDPDGNESSWGYNYGQAISNGNQVITQINNRYVLMNEDPKVAVLLNNGTASSGEAIAVSFIGRPNTKTFGSATCGLSTSNSRFFLSNEAILYLTTAYLADRNKNLYGIPIDPDGTAEDEDVMATAVEWILN